MYNINEMLGRINDIHAKKCEAILKEIIARYNDMK